MSNQKVENISKVPHGKIGFVSFHKPGFPSGGYSLYSELEFSVTNKDKANVIEDSFSSEQLEFEVSGPRFNLSPKDVYAVFPPRDSLGEHENVLPHIEINRSTLPWERYSKEHDKDVPWLGLILLQEDEWLDKEKVSITSKPWIELRDQLFEGKDSETYEEVSDHPDIGAKEFPPVKVIQIEENFLYEILPTANDLSWLTHVRVGFDPHGERVERAVMVCNRMPRAGSRAAVHLVSFEHRYDGDGDFDFSKGYEDGKVSLLSLMSWQFSCPDTEEFKIGDKALKHLSSEKQTYENKLLKSKGNPLLVKHLTERKDLLHTLIESIENFSPEEKDALHRNKESFIKFLKEKRLVTGNTKDQNDKAMLLLLLKSCHIQTETFKGLMDALDMNWLNIEGDGNHLFRSGSIPMAHGLRNGGKTTSWYRGPFVSSQILSEKLSLCLPVRNADQLLLFDKSTQMLDTSYASAWELGRLLTISQPRMSQQISQWKTSHARETALVEQNLVFSHIPFTDNTFSHHEKGTLNQSLKSYFDDLSFLHGVPFQYLIPYEGLLPHESLRFFKIDPLWIECLMDGAFSIGRTTELDNSREATASGPHKNERSPLTGVLLRSDLVSGWPSLMVDGFDQEVIENEPEPTKLNIKRFERLGPSTLLIIFEGILKTIDIHLPAESLHFGFIRPTDEDEDYSKELKSLKDGTEIMIPSGGNLKNLVRNITWKDENEELRVFDSATFSEGLIEKQKSLKLDKDQDFKSNHLAIELLEGMPRLRVKID